MARSRMFDLANNSANTTETSLHVQNIDEVVLWSVSILATVIAATIFGNLLVCTAFYMCRQLRTVTNQFVVSLAVSDLLVGFGSMPMWLVYQVGGWPANSPIYTWWLCLDIVTGTASIMNLVVISIDRYYAITAPYNYHFKLTRSRAKMAIVFVWLYSLIVAGIRASPLYSPSWKNHYQYFVSTASFFIPLPVMIFCYVQIFRVAHEQAGKIRRQGSAGYRTCQLQEISEAQTEPAEPNGDLPDSSAFYDGKPSYHYGGMRSSSSCNRSSSGAIRTHFFKQRPILTSQSSFRLLRRAFADDFKAAKTLAIVMGSFIFCWSPFIIMNLIYVSCQACIVMPMPTTAKWLHYSNSAMNPLIYTVMNRSFRDAFRKIMCRHVGYKRINLSTLAGLLPKRSNRHTERNGNECKMAVKVTEVLVCDDMVTVV